MRVDFRKIPGSTKLFSDFLYDFGKVERFYAGDFRKDKNYLRVFKSIKERKYQRENSVVSSKIRTRGLVLR